MAKRDKKPVHKVVMTEGKRQIIQQLLQEYDIETTEDIHDALKDLLGGTVFADVKERLDKAGLIMHGGTIVDATIIASTPSTKNKDKKCDLEMHQTKKGNQWYHGMKVHAGTDAGSGYTHHYRNCSQRS